MPKLRGDKFSGAQLVVGKMVAFALLRVKRAPFLNPPSALRPSSENSSAAFLLSPTEYFLSHVIPRLAELGDGDPRGIIEWRMPSAGLKSIVA